MKKAIRISLILLLATLLFSCPIEGGGSKKSGENSTPSNPEGEGTPETPETPEVPVSGPAITLDIVGNYTTGKKLYVNIFSLDSALGVVEVVAYATEYDNSKKSYTIEVNEAHKKDCFYLYATLVDSTNVILGQCFSESSALNSLSITNVEATLSASTLYENIGGLVQVNTSERFSFELLDGYHYITNNFTLEPGGFKLGGVVFKKKTVLVTLLSISGPKVLPVDSWSKDPYSYSPSYFYFFDTDTYGDYAFNIRINDGYQTKDMSVPVKVIGPGSGKGAINVTIK